MMSAVYHIISAISVYNCFESYFQFLLRIFPDLCAVQWFFVYAVCGY